MYSLHTNLTNNDIAEFYDSYDLTPFEDNKLVDTISSELLSQDRRIIPCSLHKILLSLELINTCEDAEKYLLLVKNALEASHLQDNHIKHFYFLVIYMIVYIFTFCVKEKQTALDQLFAYCLLSFDYSKICETPI